MAAIDDLGADAEADSRVAALERLARGDVDVAAAVKELRETWVARSLVATKYPGAPRLASGPPDLRAPSGDLSGFCLRILAGRALAAAMADAAPSWELWERITSLSNAVCWTSFLEEARRKAERLAGWAALFQGGVIPAQIPEQSLSSVHLTIDDAWVSRPRALPPRRAKDRVMPYPSGVAALVLLRELRPDGWYGSLNLTPNRNTAEQAISSFASSQESLLRDLAGAPLAIEPRGFETGNVAAILLARRSRDWVAEQELALRAQLTGSVGARQRMASTVLAELENHGADRWVEKFVGALLKRPDGDVLSLALLAEAVQELATRPMDSAQRCANAAHRRFAHLVGGVWRSRLEQARALLEESEVGACVKAMCRWLTLRLISDSGSELSRSDARRLWALLSTLVESSSGELEWCIRPQTVAQWVWQAIGSVLRELDDPPAALLRLFHDLWIGRERERFGGMNAVGFHLLVIASVFGMVDGGSRKPAMPLETRKRIWREAENGLRQLWLMAPGTRARQTLLTVYSCLPFAFPDAPDVVESAIRFVALDAAVALDVAELWTINGAPAHAVRSRFAASGYELDELVDAVEGTGGSWTKERLERLRLRLGVPPIVRSNS